MVSCRLWGSSAILESVAALPSPLRGSVTSASNLTRFAETTPASVAEMKKGPLKGPFIHFGSGGSLRPLAMSPEHLATLEVPPKAA